MRSNRNNFINRFTKINRSDGSFSIEAAIGIMAILMITFLAISYFTYLAPRQVITQEVQTLTQTAKIQGGLTAQDISWFNERMEERGFDSNHIHVEAVARLNQHQVRDVTNVEPLETGFVSDGNYVKRDSKEVISVKVTIPSKNNFINAMSRFWRGSNSSLGDYVFNETIMSERW